MTQTAYARSHGVSRQAVSKAVRAGLVFLDDDGRVEVEASDAIWGRRHALAQVTYGSAHGHRAAPADVEADPATLARWDRELDVMGRGLEPLFVEIGRPKR